MNLVSRKTEKGANMPGRMIDQGVLMMPSHWLTRKFGTSVTW